MIREIKQRICEFVHERNGSKALCKNQIESCLQLIRLCDVVRIMNQVESEYEQKTDWIPCEERLPSESGKYLVTEMVRTALRKYYTVGLSYFNGETWHSDFKGKFGGKDIERTVIAWQPLPVYKKEGAENE